MENEKKVRVVADVSASTKEMLDDISKRTGVKMTFIIEEGIKYQCAKLIDALGLDK